MFAELILVLIYIFPGALVDVFDRTFLSKRYKEDPSSNFEKASRYFGYSVIISTFALFIFGAVNGDGVYNLNLMLRSIYRAKHILSRGIKRPFIGKTVLF